MSSADLNKPTGKSGRGSKKGETRRKKSDSAPIPKPVQLEAEPVQLDSPQPVAELPSRAPEPQAEAEARNDAVAASSDAAPVDAAMPAETAPVNLQAIANAYGAYARKSVEDTRSFVEQLSSVRSPDKAVKLQTEFAKQAYESFVSQSHKLYELHSELTKQALKPWQGLLGKTTRDVR
jgi:phasin family protein